MYQLNTDGSAASNITLSSPSSLTIFETTSVRQLLTFSVIPSDSTMIRCAPASRYRFAARMAWDGSEVPSASSSSTELAPPAPNWMPTSGFAFIPSSWTLATMPSRSSSGTLMNPLDTSTMSNPVSRHYSRYRSTIPGPWVNTRSMNPPVDTRTSCSWQVSIRSETAFFGLSRKDPPLNLKMSTYAPIVSKMSCRYRFPTGA